ncbi:uncharacterized protein METZ01_LOCUS393715 [marine metagenome]|uniref:Uncharacterized protein n=1 Tax=marine metagenome TaxID=408172 RepID=A0A382V4N1_9ZZZZ
MKSSVKFIFLYFILAMGLALINAKNGFSQATPEDEEFNNLGPIAYANEYKLSPESDHITYRIKNQTALTIEKIYAWIYHGAEDEEGKATSLTLVNNPHRGGVITLGKPHRPGEIAEWRFPLIKTLASKIERIGGGGARPKTFTLRVSNKGIFHPKVEPPAKPEE